MSDPEFKTEVAGLAAILCFVLVFLSAQAVYDRYAEARRGTEWLAETEEAGHPGGHVEIRGDGTWSGAVRDAAWKDGPTIALVVLSVFALALALPTDFVRGVQRRRARRRRR